MPYCVANVLSEQRSVSSARYEVHLPAYASINPGSIQCYTGLIGTLLVLKEECLNIITKLIIVCFIGCGEKHQENYVFNVQ